MKWMKWVIIVLVLLLVSSVGMAQENVDYLSAEATQREAFWAGIALAATLIVTVAFDRAWRAKFGTPSPVQGTIISLDKSVENTLKEEAAAAKKTPEPDDDILVISKQAAHEMFREWARDVGILPGGAAAPVAYQGDRFSGPVDVPAPYDPAAMTVPAGDAKPDSIASGVVWGEEQVSEDLKKPDKPGET